MTKMEIEELIIAQEKKDRQTIMEVYMNIFGNETLKFRPTGLHEHHDLETQVIWDNYLYQWNTEIKV